MYAAYLKYPRNCRPFDWSGDLEYTGRFKKDFGNVEEDPDNELDNRVQSKILSSAGNPRRSVRVQTDPMGRELERHRRWQREYAARNSPQGWDPEAFLAANPPIPDSDSEGTILSVDAEVGLVTFPAYNLDINGSGQLLLSFGNATIASLLDIYGFYITHLRHQDLRCI